MKTIHNQLVNNCDSCGNTVNIQAVVRKHMYHKHRTLKQHFCILCGNTFNIRLMVRKHMHRKHRRFKQNDCIVCGSIVNIQAIMRRHVHRKHRPKKSHRKVCGMKTCTKKGLHCNYKDCNSDCFSSRNTTTKLPRLIWSIAWF